MPGVRSEARNGVYQGWYSNWQGKRTYFTGTSNKTETRRMAERFEDEHRQVRLGYRPPPTSAAKHRSRPIQEVFDEYIHWGEAQGGRGGKPWSSHHLRHVRAQIMKWKTWLGLEFLADVEGILPRAEEQLRQLQDQGLKGATVNDYAVALKAFCNWCAQRGYLDDNPLAALAPFDCTPHAVRRAMTAEEIGKLLSVSSPERCLLYEVAFLSGLRVNELRSLTPVNVDAERCGLKLDAAWTKNGKPGFQPLSPSLVRRLLEFAASGVADQLYETSFSTSHAKGKPPKGRLLYVPTVPTRWLYEDLERAEIPRHTSSGKVDFHAARTAYINLLMEDEGLTLKDFQELARHSTATLTMDVYGRARDQRMSEAISRVGNRVGSQKKRVTYVSKKAVGAEGETVTTSEDSQLEDSAAEQAWPLTTPNPATTRSRVSRRAMSWP